LVLFMILKDAKTALALLFAAGFRAGRRA
jgi:hypothetical protein